MTTKKKLALFIFILIANLIYSQNYKFEIGALGSPSITKLRGNDLTKNNHKPTIGFSSGISFQYNIKKFISVYTELSFERKGSAIKKLDATDEFGNYIGTVSTRSNYYYLNLPILAKVQYGKKVIGFINFGTFIDVLLKQENIAKWNDNTIKKYNYTSITKRIDIGLTTGIGISVPIKEKYGFVFEIRNNVGLLNISKVEVINNGKLLTNSTNFIFAFNYKFKKK